MSWRAFWKWVDQDFNDVRPYSVPLFALLGSLPLGAAFAIEASKEVVELARWFAIAGVVTVMAYYLYRSAKNIWRVSKRAFGPGTDATNISDGD